MLIIAILDVHMSDLLRDNMYSVTVSTDLTQAFQGHQELLILCPYIE